MGTSLGKAGAESTRTLGHAPASAWRRHFLGGFTGLARLAQPVVLPIKGTFRMPLAMDSHARLMRSNRTRAAFYLGDASK